VNAPLAAALERLISRAEKQLQEQQGSAS